MTNNKDSAVLKPCPFCGGQAEIAEIETEDLPLWLGECQEPPCEAVAPVRPTRDEAIVAWNTRQPAQSDVLKAAGDALRGLLDITSDYNLDSEQAGRAYAALHDIDTALKGQSK